MTQTWAVLTSCFFPNRKPLAMFLKSAQMQGVEIRAYGEGRQYANWTDMKVHQMIPELEKLKAEGFTHMLYSDGRDAFWTGDLGDVVDAFNDMDAPAVVSAQPQCFPIDGFRRHYDLTQRYPFHCPGGYCGEIDWWIETHKRFELYDYEHRPCGGDEAAVWQYGWAEGWFRPEIDHGCWIFQNLASCESDITINQLGRLENVSTGGWPAILHFNGYYTDPVSGCYDSMVKWWDRIYLEFPITKEECSL